MGLHLLVTSGDLFALSALRVPFPLEWRALNGGLEENRTPYTHSLYLVL